MNSPFAVASDLPASTAPHNTTSSPIWQWNAADMAAAIARGDISSREAVESCLSRIERTNPRLNALTHVPTDTALSHADAADAARSRGEKMGALHGVPITVKVNIDVAGQATTHGVVAKREQIATSNSPVVDNLLAAGAVIIGRSNTPAFSLRWFTDNALHGRTLNPWDDNITPGGSSGGAASAVAAGMCPIAHGNDLAGSVRYPAYACGVVGLRPTAGRLPSFTPTSGNLRTFAAQHFAVQGPIARTVHDVRLSLAAMATRDVRDPVWVPVPLEGPPLGMAPIVALVDEIEGVPIAPAVLAALQQAAGWLEDAGYTVVRVAPPRMREAFDLWMGIAMTEIRVEFADAVEAMADADAVQALRDMLHYHDPATGLKEYIRSLAQRDALRRDWNQFLEQFPLLLMPTSCDLPFAWGLDQRGPEEMGRILAAQLPLKAIAALNLPGLSVPTGLCGTTPVGVQLVSRAFREDICLAAGEIIERAANMPRAYK